MTFGLRNRHQPKAKLFAAVACVLLVGACQSSTPAPAPTTRDTRDVPPVQPALKARPKPEIARVAPEPERIYPDPDALKGISARDVIEAIGQPEFVRKDQPAEIWQYRGSACTLDVFLYQSVTGAAYKVDYIETRTQPNGPTSNRDCLVSILKERDASKTTVPTS